MLAAFDTHVATTDEDTEIVLSFDDLQAHGKDSDLDGSVESFVVQSVLSGSIKIGGDAATAAPFLTGSNDIIDAGANAYWTPDVDRNSPVDGDQQALIVTARDNEGAQSAAQATLVFVNDINDAPVLEPFDSPVAATDEDTEVEISFADLQVQNKDTDPDGTIQAFIVQSVETGRLTIGASTETATTFITGRNDTIDATHRSYWTPDENVNTAVNGAQTAFTIVAQDNDKDSSATAVSAEVLINDINDQPVLSSVQNLTATEDTVQTISFTQLNDLADSTDVDGTIVAYRITSTGSGTLTLGTHETSSGEFQPGVNDTIDGITSAYWQPDTNINSIDHGLQPVFEVVAIDNDSAESTSSHAITANVRDVNDAPGGQNNTIVILEDTPYILSTTDFGFGDANDYPPDLLHTVIITALPDNGTLFLAGTALSAGASINVNDIENDLLVFVPTANATGNDGAALSFQIRDNGGTENGGQDTSVAGYNLAFSILAENDLPTIQSNPINANEGETTIITSRNLSAADVDNAPEDLIFTLQSEPQHGQLLLSDQPVTEGRQFNQSDINNLLVSYEHDGSETDHDAFTLSLQDTSPENIAPLVEAVSIVVEEVIDPAPELTDQTIALEFSEILDSSQTTDVPSLIDPQSNYRIEIVTSPVNGTLELSPDGNFIYSHNQSLNLQDQFTYRVTNEDGVASEAAVFISVEPPLSSAYAAEEPRDNNTPEPEATVAPATEISTSVQQIIESQEFINLPDFPDESRFERNAPEFPEPVQFTLAARTGIDNPLLQDKVIQHRKWDSNGGRDLTALLTTQINVEESRSLKELFSLEFDIDDSRTSQIARDLDEQQKILKDSTTTNLEFGTRAVTVTSGFSIGYLIWLLRGGVLIGSVMSSLPAWRTLDPLPVLNNMDDDIGDSDSETLESMVDERDTKSRKQTPGKPQQKVSR